MELAVESFWDDSQVQIVWAEPAKIAALLPASMPDIVGWEKKDSVQFPADIVYVRTTLKNIHAQDGSSSVVSCLLMPRCVCVCVCHCLCLCRSTTIATTTG